MIYENFCRECFFRSAKIFAVLILLTHLFIGYADLHAQYDNIVFERINTSNGLSNNIVQKILQDSKGYLWIGTTDGLNKYDGYNFTTFRHDPDDTSSISNNNIWAIYEDKNNDLWIGNNDGLNHYNREKGNFKNYGYAPYSENFTNAVLSIYEDSKGAFWLGTVAKGLTIFDRESKKFTHYMVDSSLAGGGNSNVIFQIAEEVKTNGKRLFLGKWDMGFGYFDIEKKEYTEYKHDPNNPAGLSGIRTMATFQDRDGNIWLGTRGGGLNKFNPDTKEFVHYKNDPKNENSLSQNHVWSIFQDPNDNGILWIGTAGGLNLFDLRTNSFKSFKSDINDLTTLSDNIIRDIYQDRSGVIWIGTHGGLNKIDPGRVPFRHHNYTAGRKNWLNSNQVNAIIKSNANSNILWIGTLNGGLNKYDRSSNTFSYFEHDPDDVNTVASNYIYSLYEDPQEAGDLLWLGTIGGGLNRFDIKNNRIKKYTYDDADLGSISSNNIRHIYESRDGMLWLSTESGLNRFDRKNEIFTQYQYQDTSYNNTVQNLVKDFSSRKKPISSILKAGESVDSTETFKLAKETSVLIISAGEGTTDMFDHGWLENTNGNTIWKFEIDKSGHAGGGTKNRMQIWTGTLDAGEYKLRYVSDVGHSYANWNTPPPINPNLWGIQVFEVNSTEQNLLSTNLEKFEKPSSIISSNVYSIVEDSYGMLWIATNAGLSKLDRKTGQFTNYSIESSGSGSISNNTILSLHVDHNGTLWAGTRNGLNRYDSKNNSFKTYTIKDGLPNNIIINILEDNNGHLWLATNNGISKFNPDDESQYGYLTFINYNIQDGLRYNQYIRSSMHKAADGEMFFGGYNGFVSFFPGKSNVQTPHTLLSNFRIFNESITPGEDSPLDKHISETENIRLTYDQNAFSFEFVALHFAQPTKNKYLYKMDGFDKNWVDGHRRFAPYTNLDPGGYTFRVKAANSDGIWNERGTSLSITILPPWWRTIWAYIGYGLLFLALIFGIDRLQRRRLMAKTKERMKIQAAEHRAEAAELQARAVQAENERKTKELEEARQLQLSMLPKDLPQLPNLDIAVYMQTATEVGGDYYDFHVSLDGTLTIVVGDATGHGMKAGTMVTTAKSLFNSYAPNPDIIFSFHEITRCIRQMNFGKLSMCLSMVKIKGNKLEMSTAGMPPSFIFRQDTKSVEEHMFEAMPLGTMEKFPYKIKDTTLNPGDTILLMSDGLPELQNKDGEVYGYKRTRSGFEDVAEKSSEEIITYLKNEGASWVNNENPDDDVTFVVIKVKD